MTNYKTRGTVIMSCKRRLFKKLLFLSIAFCCVSVVYNGIIHAEEMSRKKGKAKNHVVHVKVQQEQIINSLKKIDDCLPEKKERKNERTH
tara:strand:+ start:331 stop:600 length:270 start_codon:yes stop_codon:yes gene_type:complete